MSPLVQQSSTPTPKNPAQNDAASAEMLPTAITPMSKHVADLGLDLDVNSTSSRLKNFYLPRCQTFSKQDMEPVETFVANAIGSKHASTTNSQHDKAYSAILEALRRPADPAMLTKVLVAFRSAGKGSTMIQLTGSPQIHAQLVHSLFRLNSFDPPKFKQEPTKAVLEPFQSYALADAHLNLLLNIVSAQSTNIIPALRFGWRMLTSRRVDAPDALVDRIHAFLASIMRLVPRAHSDIFPIMSSTCPFWTSSQEEIVWFYKQCLAVLRYHPTIETQILELIIDKSLEMDVNIKIKEGGDVIIEEEKLDKYDDADDDDEMETSQQVTTINSSSNSNNPRRSSMETDVDELSDKLDSLLWILFNHIQSKVQDEHTARQLYYDIAPIFESSILTTYKSKFVQFCMFQLCGLEVAALSKRLDDPVDLVDNTTLDRDFAAKLIEIVMDPYRATTTRQSGACYLASFISRANYVAPDTVCEAVAALLRWAEAYIKSLTENSIRATDAREQGKLHSLFYTVCQAAFYIMSFRGNEAILYHREAVELHKSGKESDASDDMFDPSYVNIDSKRWTGLCQHKLQPLRFCLESVRGEFLHVAHAFQLIEDDVLQRLVKDSRSWSSGKTKRKPASRISTAGTLAKRRQTGGVGGLGQGSNPLNSFFPFDPFLLRRSHDFIESTYNYWGGPLEDDDFDDEDEENNSDDDGSEDDPAAAISKDDGGYDTDDDESENGDAPEDDGDENFKYGIVGDSDSDSDASQAGENDDDASAGTPRSIPRAFGFTDGRAQSVGPIMSNKRSGDFDEEAIHDAWNNSAKRPRSQSIQSNGSW